MRLFGRCHLIVSRQPISRNTYHIVEHGPFAGIFGAVKVGGIDTVFGKGVAVAGFGKGPFVFTKEFAPHFAKRTAKTIAQAVHTLGNRTQGNRIFVTVVPTTGTFVLAYITHIVIASFFAKSKACLLLNQTRNFAGFFTTASRFTSRISSRTEDFTHRPIVGTRCQAGENTVEEALQHFIFPLNPVPFAVEFGFPFFLGAGFHHIPPPGFFAVIGEFAVQISFTAAGAKIAAAQTADFAGLDRLHLRVH